jgi:hypothetical protein
MWRRPTAGAWWRYRPPNWAAARLNPAPAVGVLVTSPPVAILGGNVAPRKFSLPLRYLSRAN